MYVGECQDLALSSGWETVTLTTYTSMPDPGTGLLFGSGIGVLGFFRRALANAKH